MDQKACLTQLSRLLAEEGALLVALESQLKREHELLQANDIEGLELASHERQQSVASLLRVDDERRRLCRMNGKAQDQAGLAALLQWSDPEGSLAADYARCSTLAQNCREQNDRNGVLVNARLNRVSNMLGVLSTNTTPTTYQQHGQTAMSPNRATGRMLSVSA